VHQEVTVPRTRTRRKNRRFLLNGAAPIPEDVNARRPKFVDVAYQLKERQENRAPERTPWAGAPASTAPTTISPK
jgi:hypothetical protein